MKRTFLPLQRREFITLLGGATATPSVLWPFAARAQQPAMPVIGSLCGVSAVEWADRIAGFRRGLNEAGFVEGRNVAIEYRWAEGHFDRLPAMATELIGRKVSAIFVTGSNVATQAAMAATQSIPIVFTTAGDPVAAGFVASLNRPGGNVTGVTTFGAELVSKKLDLLHEVVPAATKIALLVNPNNPVAGHDDVQGVQLPARRLGLEVIVLNGGTEREIESALATAVKQHAAALFIGNDSFLNSRREQIAALALRHAFPTITSERVSVMAGELMSYGSDQADVYSKAGIYVARILKGERPAELPVQQPTKFELVINLKTAKALGLTITESFILRADEVIE
jgi:putative ABC transport system substrate-binding protein